MRQSVAFGALNEQRAIMQLVSTHLSPNPAIGSFDKQAICTGERAEDQQEQNEITNRLFHQYAFLSSVSLVVMTILHDWRQIAGLGQGCSSPESKPLICQKTGLRADARSTRDPRVSSALAFWGRQGRSPLMQREVVQQVKAGR